MSVEMTSLFEAFERLLHLDYDKAEDKEKFIKDNFYETTDDSGNKIYKSWNSELKTLIQDGFSLVYNINLHKRRGHTLLHDLINHEIDNYLMEQSMPENYPSHIMTHIMGERRVRTMFDVFNPPVVPTPTDVEAIQCFICATNKKDRVLNCGHSYCCACVRDIPNNKCPDCNTEIEKSKIIKLFL